MRKANKATKQTVFIYSKSRTSSCAGFFVLGLCSRFAALQAATGCTRYMVTASIPKPSLTSVQ
jgi:hypothetical protein